MVNVKPLQVVLTTLFIMSTKVILIRIIGDGDGDGEPLPNSRKKFNPMSAKDLEATIRYMNPTMDAFTLEKNGCICAVNDKTLESGDYNIEICTAEVAGN